MAIELYANFENTGHSNLFYRLTSDIPYTFLIKLSDSTSSNDYTDYAFLSTQGLTAWYILNNDSSVQYFDFTVPLTAYGTEWEPLSVVTAFLSSNSSSVSSWSISAQFLAEFPRVNMGIFATTRFLADGQAVQLDLSNVSISSHGPWFFGEGHTEKVILSALPTYIEELSTYWTPSTDLSAIWIIENHSVSSTSSHGLTAETLIPSTVGSYPTLLVKMLWTSTKIPSSSPLYYFDDITGDKIPYPYWNLGSITTYPYPTNVLSLSTSFSVLPNSFLYLPLNNSFRVFQTNVDLIKSIHYPFLVLSGNNIHNPSHIEYTWSVTSPFWSVEDTAYFPISSYTFSLQYHHLFSLPLTVNENIDSETEITVKTKASTYICISAPPFDWQSKPINLETDKAFYVLPKPNIFLYTNTPITLTGVPILFDILTTNNYSGFVGLSVLADNQILELSALSSFEISFSTLGFKDITLLFQYSADNVFILQKDYPAIVQIVPNYELVENDDVYSILAYDIQLPWPTEPILAANEFGIADNINALVDKFYDNLEFILNKNRYYQLSAFSFIGWLGPDKYAPLTVKKQQHIPYRWFDLECPSKYNLTWTNVECDESSSTITKKLWSDHTCQYNQFDPFCLQKYCISWRWSDRKCNSTPQTTWKTTSKNNIHAKKWLYEPCELVEEEQLPIVCEVGHWHVNIPGLDQYYNEIPSCNSYPECNIKGVLTLKNNQLIVALSKELRALSNHYIPQFIDQQKFLNKTTLFQEIEAIDKDLYDRIYVLDKVQSQVSVFRFLNNKIQHFHTWGGYGGPDSVEGFFNPTDLHIDKDNYIWICDSGNRRLKKLTMSGEWISTLVLSENDEIVPLSLVQDFQGNLHVLCEDFIIRIYDTKGHFIKSYTHNILKTRQAQKIAISHNRKIIYISCLDGVVKFFSNGKFFENFINPIQCSDGITINFFSKCHQNKYRDVFVGAGDKVLKYNDRLIQQTNLVNLGTGLWSREETKIGKNEFVIDWVMKRVFYRLWDNIELIKNALKYSSEDEYIPPTYQKEDILLGHNELVTNSIINRGFHQLWVNFQNLWKCFSKKNTF